MALNGVNLCLAAQIGQEAVWQRVLRKLGSSDEEISQYLPGPAFGAWWMMGNLQGWGGPDPQWWIDRQAALQTKILKRMRELGIQPVLAAYYGNAPTSLKAHFPNSQFRSTGIWVGYQRPDMIVPTDQLFQKVAQAFYTEQARLFGPAKFYAGDPFHEGSVADVNLKETGEAIQNSMQQASPDSSWVLQAWGNNPHDEMLAGTTPKNTLVLDLRGEGGGSWRARKEFGGRPWILCTIGGFGGKSHFSGWMSENAAGTFRALGAPGMSGFGAIMEGSGFNDAPYQFLYDLAWRQTAPNLEEWCADYARRRYGMSNTNVEQAWKIFSHSVYSLPRESAADGEAESVLCARPALHISSASSWGTTKRTYRFGDLFRGWKLLANAKNLSSSDPYVHDLVDVTRQVLSDWGQVLQTRMTEDFEAKNPSAFSADSQSFLGLISDMDRLLSTRKEFKLGTWIESARAIGQTPKDKDWLEWNARTQLTTWGHGGATADLRDYANKEWAGLLSGFYAKRWSRWIEDRKQELRGVKVSAIDWMPWELAWNHGHEPYSSRSTGNSLAEVSRIRALYGSTIERFISH